MHKPNDYVVHTPMTADPVLEKAAEIVANRYLRSRVFTNLQATKDFLQYKMAGYEREVFTVLLIDIRVLDHFVVGETCISFAERGVLMIEQHYGELQLPSV